MILLPLIALALWVLAALALDRYGLRPLPQQARFDAIVVLGCRVYADGKPSPALARRVRRAVELYEQGKAPLLVLTGGVGGHPPSEARAAADLAAELGVPRSAMRLEEASTSTEENARFAAELVDVRRVLIVSDAYHVFRGERVFGRYFEEVRGVGSVGLNYPRVVGSLREVLAVGGYALTGRLGGGA